MPTLSEPELRLSFLDNSYHLIEKDSECFGASNQLIDRRIDRSDDCADACREISKYFIFEANEEKNTCNCHTLGENNDCKITDKKGSDLYAFKGKS